MAHHWITGGRLADRKAFLTTLELPPVLAEVDAHRNLRGPYTAAGTLLRRLAPEVLRRNPDLAVKHDIELLSVAPELREVLPNSRQTLTSMALPAERTRFYARLRTFRTAHGLVEFFRDGAPPGRWTVVIDNVDQAEFTDQEFLAAAVRRWHPARLTLVIGTGGSELAPVLAEALERHAQRHEVGSAELGAARASTETGAEAAWRYVHSDCTSDEVALAEAYWALPAAERAALHDRRASELAGRGEFSLTLGALTLHRERGTDAERTGVASLYQAQDHCLCLGFYDAVVDYAQRAMAMIDPVSREEDWWSFAVELGLAWSILGRTHEAMALYDQARLVSARPAVHMAAAYSTAMLYTRHNDPAERDEKLAKSWLHAAMATASLLPDRVQRAFQSAFYANGLALVEVNLGDLNEALRLVNECIAGLDEKLEPHEHRLHRAVLKNNRARVHLGLGNLDAAIADYGVIIGEDPNHCEHYLERGNILRRVGRTDEAFADYARAISLTPPFPEIHYNRGDLFLTVGDVDSALADFSYVLELDPTFLDAYVNRAGIYLEAGAEVLAKADALAGLALDPTNAHLHAVLGQVLSEEGQPDQARAAFDAALAADPTLISALSGRASLAYEQGDPAAALADLTTALELDGNNAALRYNRGFLYLESERWDEALADLNVAAELTPDDEAVVEALQSCRRQLAAS